MLNGLISHCCQRAQGYSVKQQRNVYTAGGLTRSFPGAQSKLTLRRHIVSIHSCPRTHHQDWFGPFCVTLKGLKGNVGLHSFSLAAHLPSISRTCCHSAGTNYSQAVSSYSWPRASQSISDRLATFYLRGLFNFQVPGNVQVRSAKEELLPFFSHRITIATLSVTDRVIINI